MEKHFLEQYKTQDKPEAKKAAERKETRTGEEGISDDRGERIQAYIERLEKVFLNPDPKTRARNIELLKPTIYENTIITEENFPDSYFEYQKQEAKKRGMGDMEVSAEEKRQSITDVQEAQRKSLDAWIDHLASEDSHYPADIKYFVMQGVLKMGKFDEKAYRFSSRDKSTTATFRQLDHEALSLVMGALEAVHHPGGDTSPYHKELLDLIKRSSGFGSMYAEAMRSLDMEAGKDKALEITDGAWRVFKQGSDPQELVKTFAGKRAYLCLGNIGDASGYLERGDMQVYFSNNRAGEPVWPRVAIAVEPVNGVYEMRGTYNTNEDIDPEIAKTDILKERLATIQNGESFLKKDADMKKVTELYEQCFKIDKKTGEKTLLKPVFTKDELVFLYEINALIKGFGYGDDPRIEEIRSQRNQAEDLPIIFECDPHQIAYGKDQIKGDTVAYIGEWTPEVLKFIPESTRYVYEKFPQKKAFIRTIESDPNIKNATDAVRALKEKGNKISDYAKDLLKKVSFSGEQKQFKLVSFSVKALGFPEGATRAEIYARAQALGLELCPAEVGPQLRLQYEDQPLGEYLVMGMDPMADSGGGLNFFRVHRIGGGLWLDGSRGRADDQWGGSIRFVFLRRK